MAFTTNTPAPTMRLTPAAATLPAPINPASWLRKAAIADLAVVHYCASMTRRATIKWLAITISKLGNGWIYLILIPPIALELGSKALPTLACALVNAAFLHVIYPVLKRRFRRRRPYRADPQLVSLLQTLDEHSFPSGHVMTLTGVLLPIIIALPATRAPALGLVLTMAWSRMATAHHYPSDVIAGVAMGAAIAFPLTRWMMAFC
jgi:undecaprenyl-diphosphatase